MIENGLTVNTHTFQKAMKVLNSDLKICSGGDNGRLAGLYMVNKKGEWETICGVDKKYVPAYTSFDASGHVIKAGWRRVFWILYAIGLTTSDKIKKVCPGFFDSRAKAYDKFTGGIAGDWIGNKILKYMQENTHGDPFMEGANLLTPEQILDLGLDIQARDTVKQREDREHDKWFLERWQKQGGGVTDRPNY